MRGGLGRAVTIVLGTHFALVALFLLLPLLVVIPASFNDEQWLHFPPESLSLRWYRNYFDDPGFIRATLTSFWIAGVVSAVATFIGVITSLGMRVRFPGRTLVYGLIIAPLVIPVVIFALALFILYNGLGLTGSVSGLIVAHVVLALPFPVLIVSSMLQQLDPTLERAARVLGASPIQAFRNVTLPFLKPAVFASAVFAFFVSFDELVVALFVTGRWDTLPKRIWSDLRLEIDPTIAAVASLLIAINLICITAAEFMRRRALKRAGQ